MSGPRITHPPFWMSLIWIFALGCYLVQAYFGQDVLVATLMLLAAFAVWRWRKLKHERAEADRRIKEKIRSLQEALRKR
jgi:hypothetical protein